MPCVDNGEDVVNVIITDIVPEKLHKDGSATFKTVGGPYHNFKVRVYQPYLRVVFDHPSQGVLVYEISPPVQKGGKWVYVYTPEDKNEYTEAERGDINWRREVEPRWEAYAKWKKAHRE